MKLPFLLTKILYNLLHMYFPFQQRSLFLEKQVDGICKSEERTIVAFGGNINVDEYL